MSEFTLRHPGLLRSVRNRWRFRDHFARIDSAPKLRPQEQEWVRRIREDGFVEVPGFIAPGLLERVRRDFEDTLGRLDFEMPCLAQARIDPERHADLLASNIYASNAELEQRGLTFDRDEAHSLEQVVEQFRPSTLTAYPLAGSAAHREVWFDERLLRCVAAYLGMVPYLVEAYVRRNYPAPHRSMNHFWHRDLNGDHLLKAFFFLTDCKIETGPHEFIRGSHRELGVLNGQRYYSDEEVDRLHPPGSPKRVVSEVTAGTLILEDTRGIHRARVPDSGLRDLGYAVFVPLPAGTTSSLYRLQEEDVALLTDFQKSFIPPGASRS